MSNNSSLVKYNTPVLVSTTKDKGGKKALAGTVKVHEQTALGFEAEV